MIGRTVSHYHIVEHLGEGGMGVVYKARDTLLSRHVALKVLPLTPGSEMRRRRLLREARACSALNHPSIVTIHDVVSDEDADYIVMEFVEGRTLEHHLRSGPLSVPDALRFACEIADAVGTAHHAGVIHRDLKPSNLMITRAGRLKVLDFGLARLTTLAGPGDEEPTVTADRTHTGTILGTFGYMSPEQTRGETVDERSDVFSLGIVMYEMLAGERPFRSANPISTMQQIAFTPARPLADARVGIPAPVAAIVERALAKSREDRYQSMEELATDLRAVTEAGAPAADIVLPSGATAGSMAPGSGPEAAPRHATGPERTRQQPARFTVRSKAGVMALVLLAASLAYAGRNGLTWLTGNGGVAAPLPSTPFGHYQAGLTFLGRFDRPGYIEEALDSFQRAIALDDQYAPAYAGYARASWYQYLAGLDPTALTRARDNALRAIELGPQLSFARATLGQILIEEGEFGEAQSHITAALTADPGSPESHSAQADLYAALDDTDKAEAEYRQAISLRPEDWRLHDDLGSFYLQRRRYDDALPSLEESVRLSPDNSLAYRDLSAVHQSLGDFATAARALQHSLEIKATASGYSNLGTLYFYQSMFKQAVDAFEQALAIDANNYLVWANLGDAYRWTPDNRANAAEAYQRAIQLLNSDLEKNPADATLRSRRALYFAKRGQRREALDDLALVDWEHSDDLALLLRIIPAFDIASDRATALKVLEAALVAGLPLSAVQDEPELTDLRSDSRYHRIAMRYPGKAP